MIESRANCKREVSWPFGKKFIKNLKAFKGDSVSGHVEFQKHTGFRKNLTLSLVEKTKKGIDLVFYYSIIIKPKSYICIYSKSKYLNSLDN